MHALPSPTPYPPPQEDNCDQSEKINTIKTDLMLGRLGGGGSTIIENRNSHIIFCI